MLVALVAIASACGAHAPAVRIVRPAEQRESARVSPTAPSPATRTLGIAPSPAALDRNDLVGPVHSSSIRLAATLTDQRGLAVTPLHSPYGTAALSLVESDDAGARGGSVLLPAERRFFAAFPSDRSLGTWLVLVDDVRVHGAPDPIPMTGYRWARSALEMFARCGIPARALDGCARSFDGSAQMWVGGAGSRHDRG